MTDAAKLNLYRAALREILDTQGHVCEGFDLCTHRACASSSTSWFIADRALNEAGERYTEEDAVWPNA